MITGEMQFITIGYWRTNHRWTMSKLLNYWFFQSSVNKQIHIVSLAYLLRRLKNQKYNFAQNKNIFAFSYKFKEYKKLFCVFLVILRIFSYPAFFFKFFFKPIIYRWVVYIIHWVNYTPFAFFNGSDLKNR